MEVKQRRQLGVFCFFLLPAYFTDLWQMAMFLLRGWKSRATHGWTVAVRCTWSCSWRPRKSYPAPECCGACSVGCPSVCPYHVVTVRVVLAPIFFLDAFWGAGYHLEALHAQGQVICIGRSHSRPLPAFFYSSPSSMEHPSPAFGRPHPFILALTINNIRQYFLLTLLQRCTTGSTIHSEML